MSKGTACGNFILYANILNAHYYLFLFFSFLPTLAIFYRFYLFNQNNSVALLPQQLLTEIQAHKKYYVRKTIKRKNNLPHKLY